MTPIIIKCITYGFMCIHIKNKCQMLKHHKIRLNKMSINHYYGLMICFSMIYYQSNIFLFLSLSLVFFCFVSQSLSICILGFFSAIFFSFFFSSYSYFSLWETFFCQTKKNNDDDNNRRNNISTNKLLLLLKQQSYQIKNRFASRLTIQFRKI